MRNWTIKLFAPAVSAAVVGVAFLAIRYGPVLFEDAWLHQARSVHAAWTDSEGSPPGEVLRSRKFLAEMRRLGAIPHVPDLIAARLHIAQVRYIEAARSRLDAIHVGYRDKGRCRVSLWIAKSPAADTGPLVGHNRRTAYSWRAGGLRYVLLASDLQDDHFHLIAAASRDMTITRSGPDEPLRNALRLSAILSRRCDG